MSKYNLTKQQKEFLKDIITLIRKKAITEELWLVSNFKKASLFSPITKQGVNYPSSKYPKFNYVLTHRLFISTLIYDREREFST